MKSLVIASALVLALGTASAADVSVGGVYDYTLNKAGVRVTASAGKLGPITPTVSYTRVDEAYNRFALGGELPITNLGPVKVAATAAGVYQDTLVPGIGSGYGLTAGLKATYDVTKNVAVTAGVERFVGQDRISAFDGTVASVGVAYRF